MIITISGRPGSGKSTVGKLVAEKLKLRHYSIGDFMRQLAKSRGMGLNEFTKIAIKDPEIDRKLDEKTIGLGKREDNFVIDGRLAFHFISNSIKIFLDADLNEAAKRIFNEKRKEESAESIKEILKELKDRVNAEKIRYGKYYGIKDFTDKRNYDLVIDTTNLTISQVADKITRFAENKTKKPKYL